MKRTFRSILLLIFIFIFGFSAWQLWRIFSGYTEGEESYDQLDQYVSIGQTEEVSVNIPLPTVPPTEEPAAEVEVPDVSAWPQVDFEQLAEINPDVVGWIFIEGTRINYPIVQGTDNSYYLNHLFDGKHNSTGCIFMDYRCASDFTDQHSIIYGHRMKNKSMFQGLLNYKDQTFYEEHPVALIVTPTAYYKIQFFSGYVSDNWSSAWDLALDGADYGEWLKEIKEKSRFETTCSPTSEDRIVTLSTCTTEFSGAKFVLHGYISEHIEKRLLQQLG